MLASVTCAAQVCQGILVPLVPTVFEPIISVPVRCISVRNVRECSLQRKMVEFCIGIGFGKWLVSAGFRRKVPGGRRAEASTHRENPRGLMERTGARLCSSANRAASGCGKNVR